MSWVLNDEARHGVRIGGAPGLTSTDPNGIARFAEALKGCVAAPRRQGCSSSSSSSSRRVWCHRSTSGVAADVTFQFWARLYESPTGKAPLAVVGGGAANANRSCDQDLCVSTSVVSCGDGTAAVVVVVVVVFSYLGAASAIRTFIHNHGNIKPPSSALQECFSEREVPSSHIASHRIDVARRRRGVVWYTVRAGYICDS